MINIKLTTLNARRTIFGPLVRLSLPPPWVVRVSLESPRCRLPKPHLWECQDAEGRWVNFRSLVSFGFLDLVLYLGLNPKWVLQVGLPLLVYLSKVRRSDESQWVRFAAVSWHCLPASSNWFSLSGGGLCNSSAPNVGGPQTAPVSCFGFFNRNGFPRCEPDRVLVIVNSRKVAETLPVRSI